MRFTPWSTRRPRRLLAASLSFSLGLLGPLLAQERGIHSQRPVQTELIAPLDAGRLHRGAPVFAKVKYDWDGLGCKLSAGSTVIGYVADLEQRSKQSKGSSITLVFNKADCNRQSSTPLNLVVFAVIAQVAVHYDSGMTDTDGLFGNTHARAMTTMGGGKSTGTSGEAVAPPSYSPSTDMSVRSGKRKQAPGVILPGQVVNLKKVTLSVGTGTDGGSVVSSLSSNVRLERETALILMPRDSLVAIGRSVAASASSDTQSVANQAIGDSVAEVKATAAPPVPPAAPPPEPIDETEICSTACSTATNDETISNVNAFASLSAAHLGYLPHDRREFSEFNYESALTYLNATKLLLTFDLHKLRQRSGNAIRSESTRLVRAVVIDASTQTVERILDWQVPGEGQYLWRAGPDHILVHIGHQLRLFGDDLTPVRMLPIPGPLAWVAASPDGSHFAIGILHERHSADLHRQIFDATNIEPEEDIDIQVFDSEFHLLLTAIQPSTLYAPVLADTGEVLVHTSGHDRWRISELRWDSTEHQIAETTSRCHPTVTAPLADRVFVVGCTVSPSLNWYGLLRMDGHTVLKNRGSSQEMEQAARGSATSQVAIRVVRTFKSTLSGNAFHKSDVKEQEISVYDASDGRRLFTTTADDIPLSEQPFALSPSGHQIAVLRNRAVAFYSVGEAAAGANSAIRSFR